MNLPFTPPFNYTFITMRIVVGSLPYELAHIQDLYNRGVSHFINLFDESDYANLIQQLAFPQSVTYLWNPTLDDGSPKPVEWFKKVSDIVVPALSQPYNKVFFNCQAGVNRSASMAYYIIRLLTGMSPVDTEILIDAHRPIDLVGIRYSTSADDALHRLGYV